MFVLKGSIFGKVEERAQKRTG